jgi:hypothetical protein
VIGAEFDRKRGSGPKRIKIVAASPDGVSWIATGLDKFGPNETFTVSELHEQYDAPIVPPGSYDETREWDHLRREHPDWHGDAVRADNARRTINEARPSPEQVFAEIAEAAADDGG